MLLVLYSSSFSSYVHFKLQRNKKLPASDCKLETSLQKVNKSIFHYNLKIKAHSCASLLKKTNRNYPFVLFQSKTTNTSLFDLEKTVCTSLFHSRNFLICFQEIDSGVDHGRQRSRQPGVWWWRLHSCLSWQVSVVWITLCWKDGCDALQRLCTVRVLLPFKLTFILWPAAMRNEWEGQSNCMLYLLICALPRWQPPQRWWSPRIAAWSARVLCSPCTALTKQASVSVSPRWRSCPWSNIFNLKSRNISGKIRIKAQNFCYFYSIKKYTTRACPWKLYGCGSIRCDP